MGGIFASSESNVTVNQKQDIAYNPTVNFNTNPVVEPPGSAVQSSGNLQFAGNPAPVLDVAAQIPRPSTLEADASGSPFSGKTLILIAAAIGVYLLLSR